MDTPLSIEAVGASVEEAIGRGLDALNVRRDQVSVDIIESGGSRSMARVRVTLVEPAAAGALAAPPAPAAGPVEPASDAETQLARETLLHLLQQMRIHGSVEAQPALPEDARDANTQTGPTLILNIQGDDLGVLIGRRGETLRDLQHIARAIVSKKSGRSINLVVDVEGYKQRRDQQLRQLAARLAERVVASRKPLALEPMPANERRIIHLALRDHPSVTTQSVGQGESRKVTIVPKSHN